MKTIKRMSDAEIVEISGQRREPCTKVTGECYIVTKLILFTDDELITIDSAEDVNVFATEREAREWIAKMMLSKDDSCSSVKHTYTTRCHTLDESNLDR